MSELAPPQLFSIKSRARAILHWQTKHNHGDNAVIIAKMIQVAYAKCSLEIAEKCCQAVIRSKQVYTSDFTRATTSGFSSRVVTWMQPCALEAVKRKNKKI